MQSSFETANFCGLHPKRLQWVDSCLACFPLALKWIDEIGFSCAGFETEDIVWLDSIVQILDKPARAIETGGGNSTLVFLMNQLNTHTYTEDRNLFNDIEYVIKQRSGFENSSLFKADYASILNSSKLQPNSFDLGLINGPAGFPYPTLEFYLMLSLIKKGGFLIIGNLGLPNPDLVVRNIQNIGEWWFKPHSWSPSRSNVAFQKMNSFEHFPQKNVNSFENITVTSTFTGRVRNKILRWTKQV